MKKIVSLAAALLVLTLGARLVMDRFTETQAEAPVAAGVRPVLVELAQVRVMDLRRVVEFTGTLEAEARFVVAPKVSGRLDKLHVNIGDQVENGRIIAELDGHEYAQQVDEAAAALEVARATVIEAASDLALAERDLDRSQRLMRRDAVSQSELDQAQAQVDSDRARLLVAQAQVRQKEAALEAARIRLAYTRIAASWNGPDPQRVVGQRFAQAGDMIDANDPIVSVVSLNPLLAVINVIERDFPFVRQGQTASVFADAFPGKTFQGRVSRVAPVIDEASRQARVEVEVPNPDALLAPGMFVRARLGFAEHKGVAAAPSSALTRRDEVQGVFLARDNDSRARFVPVKTGIEQDGWIEILEPAAAEIAGGRVVTRGKHLIEDGGAISPHSPSGPKAGS